MTAQDVNHESVIMRNDASQGPHIVNPFRMDPAEFARIVRSRLDEIGQSPYRAAVSHRLPRDAIRYVLSGRMPRLDRALEICEALDLEFYVGPPRPPPQEPAARSGTVPASRLVFLTHELVRIVSDAGADPVPEDVWPELVERRKAREQE